MNMRTVRAVFFVLGLSVLSAMAGGETMRGKVKADFDEKKKLTGVTFSADGGESYELGTSGAAKKLAKDADGETVELKGSVNKKKDKEGNEVKQLKVGNFRVLFIGKVAVEKDGKKITGVSIGGRELKFDGKAKELAAKAAGKDVEATGGKAKIKVGSGKEKEEKEVLVIKSYSLTEETKEKKDKK